MSMITNMSDYTFQKIYIPVKKGFANSPPPKKKTAISINLLHKAVTWKGYDHHMYIRNKCHKFPGASMLSEHRQNPNSNDSIKDKLTPEKDSA